MKLFEEELISLSMRAQMAGLPLAAFMQHLHAQGIPVARPAPVELEEERRLSLVRLRGRRGYNLHRTSAASARPRRARPGEALLLKIRCWNLIRFWLIQAGLSTIWSADPRGTTR